MLDQGLINIFTAIVVGYAIFIVALGLAVARARDSVQLRVDHYATRVRMLEDIELERPLGERVFQPLLRSMARLLLRLVPRLDLKDVQLKLYRAGSPFNWTPVDFLGVRVALGLLFLLPGVLLFLTRTFPLLNTLLLTVVLGAIGFLLPVFWLGSKMRARQKEIQRDLPDAIDLLTVSVEAGLGLEAAMSKVAEHTDNELGRAFGRAMAEVQLGRARSAVLRDMAQRSGVSDMIHFVTTIIQAEQLGVSIAKVLLIQSDEIRIKRRQRAEEEAHRAPVKMSVVLVLLLMPALFLVLLGPSVQNICHLMNPNNRFCG